MVLTEYAPKIAAGEENGAGTVYPRNAGLFTEMGSRSDKGRKGRGAAETASRKLASRSSAVPRTVITDIFHESNPLSAVNNIQKQQKRCFNGTDYTPVLSNMQEIKKNEKKYMIFDLFVLK